MTDKMREAFEEWAKAECLDLDSVDGFYSDNDTHIAWGAWQAAQSAAVPVAIMDTRCTYLAFAGRVCNKCGRIHTGKSAAVPVVGDVVATRCGDDAEGWTIFSSDVAENYAQYTDCNSQKLVIQPATSITADELDALRKDAERYRWIRRPEMNNFDYASEGIAPVSVFISDDLSFCATEEDLDQAIDAAIAGEKNHG